MPYPSIDRIFGVETEFGCLVADPSLGSPEAVVDKIKNHLFYEMRIGALDLHARDEVFEPAQSGGFLLNGGRMYVDAVGSHLEYATAECRDLKHLIANDRAGQRLVVRAIKELGLAEQVSVYNNSVDHFGGHTFGCHENYLVQMDDDFFSHQAPLLYPFLVTRQIYAGVGRVGGHLLTSEGSGPTYQEVMEHPVDYIWVSQVYGVMADPDVRFQLSQRADHILKTIASRVRFNRALINPKWEHFYSHDHMQRLHLLFGESNQNEYAYALKVGTTLLVLRLLEEKMVPESVLLAHPLIALRSISRDEKYQWKILMADGTESTALELQQHYLDLSQKYKGESEQTDWILIEWSKVLEQLKKDPMKLSDRLDWVAKLQVIQTYIKETGLDPQDDSLHSIDLEYHNIDPEKSLFYALQQMEQTKRVVTDVNIIEAIMEPPPNTRAKGRAELVKEILDRKNARFYAIDWNGVALDRHHYIEMPDPFETYTQPPEPNF